MKNKVRFRLFNMPCCQQLLCWVNTRLPNYCPECGKPVFSQLKSGNFTGSDSEAWLDVMEPINGRIRWYYPHMKS